MTIRFPVQPRMIPPAKVARRLGLSLAEYEVKRPALEASGFPKADAILGNYSLEAVDKWIDARAGLKPAGAAVSDPSVMAERVKAWAR